MTVKPASAVTKVVLSMLVSLSQPSAGHADLIVNGSFEDPVISSIPGYETFTTIPGWNIAFPGGGSFEIHHEGLQGWGPAADGVQWTELDVFDSTGIYQDISTVPGQVYALSFAFSPRPGTTSADNILGVSWGGTDVDVLSRDGLANLDWQQSTYFVTATSALTRLQFEDRGVSNSEGTFLDNVSLTAVPEPSSFALVGAITVGGAWWKRRRSHRPKRQNVD